uniref:Uncharacterized protein n=1 Tax=Davidia involucrata TaxID=16924 RepID=A0A5B6YTY9_DAVIN
MFFFSFLLDCIYIFFLRVWSRLHCYLVDWTPKQSIFKLIAVLCLPQMKVPLDVNRLLAWNTKEVNKIFNHYAMEGKFIEMAALLMVAREKVMASSMFQRKDSFGLDGRVMVRRSILQEIALLTDEEIKSTGNSRNCKSVRMLKNMKAMMKFSLMLLEVFERAGDAIETYRQAVQSEMPTEKLVKDIKALLEEAGFVLKDNDIDLSNINCGRENIYVATKVLEQRSTFGSQLQDLRMQLHSPSGSFREENDPVTNQVNEPSWSISRFSPFGHLFCTLQCCHIIHYGLQMVDIQFHVPLLSTLLLRRQSHQSKFRLHIFYQAGNSSPLHLQSRGG